MTISRRECMWAAVGAGVAVSALPIKPLRAQTAGEQVMGDPAAPVTMIEYSSLTCPHCAAFHVETLPELKSRYIDTGKVKLVMRDFPLDGVALKAALLAHCAGPERYFTFLNALFANQERWARARDPLAALEQLALAGGLGKERLAACWADREMEDGVLAMRLSGEQEFQIRSTPSFIIGGEVYPGNRSPEDFAAIIEPLLPES
jgi:protein-disulfide isomerase